MRKIYITSLALFLGFSSLKAQDALTSEEEVIKVEKVEESIVINWESSLEDAKKRAKEENKPLLIYFTGSDWCGPCKVLNKKLFNTEKFKEYADSKLVLYKADFPRNKDLVEKEARKSNEKLQVRYGQRKFPTMVIVDKNGDAIDSKRGMYMTEYYYSFFDKAIRSF